MNGWREENGSLVLDRRFTGYTDGLQWAIAVGHLADELNHHPTISVGYRTVRVTTTTVDAGSVVTDRDRELAAAIDALVLDDDGTGNGE